MLGRPEQPRRNGIEINAAGQQPFSSGTPETINHGRRKLVALTGVGGGLGVLYLADQATGGSVWRALFGGDTAPQAPEPANPAQPDFAEKMKPQRLDEFKRIVRRFTTAENAVTAAINTGEQGTNPAPANGEYIYDTVENTVPGQLQTTHRFTIHKAPEVVNSEVPTFSVHQWHNKPPLGENKLQLSAYLGTTGVETVGVLDVLNNTLPKLTDDEAMKRAKNFLNPELGEPVGWYYDGVPGVPRENGQLVTYLDLPQSDTQPTDEHLKLELDFSGKLTLRLYDGLHIPKQR